ncbi:hypothetical protein GWI33_002751 [Rhynchophorus ferrugineus]|uniref:FLYWCH-type domain-containing protein n=1 Tax=Rhynchophorus ferrugineus TaxID=354439 RepID=A0A834ML59_RHYFE|nr:hypothetical protein GWI33_002751 [Rhynchophorus ferrugineus]
MIIDGYEYRLQMRSVIKSSWCCTQDFKYRCKVRLMATGKQIQIKDCAHTHEKTFKGNYENLKSYAITLEYTKKFRRLYTVHFARGRKNPIMIIDGYEYRLQVKGAVRSRWCCTQDIKHHCKVRLMATSSLIQIKDCAHTHERTFKGNYEDLETLDITIEHTKKFRRE